MGLKPAMISKWLLKLIFRSPEWHKITSTNAAFIRHSIIFLVFICFFLNAFLSFDVIITNFLSFLFTMKYLCWFESKLR